MTSQILEKIEQIKAELERNDVPAPFRELTLSPQDYMRLRREVGDMPSGAVNHNPLTGQVDSVLGMPVKVQKPGLEPFKPDQEEMDKLASVLTEAVLQLRAGDMDGARKTLMGADYQCGIRIQTQPYKGSCWIT